MQEKSQRERCKKFLLELLDDDSCIIIKNIKNIRYLSNFSGSYGIIYMEKDRSLFICDRRYEERCYKEVKNFEILIVREPFREALLRSSSKKNLLAEYLDLSLAELEIIREISKDIEVKDISYVIRNFRMKKDGEEKRLIKEASKINKRAYERFAGFVEKNIGKITERDAALELEYLMRKEGSETPYFPTIVASGGNASVPHAKPSDKKIEQGPILIDFGSVKDGYSTDETVVLYAGKVDEEYKRMWEILRDAKNYAVDSIKVGERLSLPEARAREFLSRYDLEKFFVHSIGHGVGLEVHELPKLSRDSNGVFEEGMVFTIEPGIYIKEKLGIRLEDVICLSYSGIEILTEINKEAIISV
jgi:Xaa-Pro aminopeptidase